MADESDKLDFNSRKRARTLMNDLLKSQTICGELNLMPAKKKGYLALHNTEACAKELANLKPTDMLSGVHGAIEKQIKEDLQKYEKQQQLEAQKTEAKNNELSRLLQAFIPSHPVTEQSLRNLYYEAADQVLKRDNGQPLVSYKPETGEKAPDNGLVCRVQPRISDPSVTNVLSCKKPPTR